MNTLPEEKYITCSCHTEGLHMMVFPGEAELYMSMFYIGRSYKLSFLERLKYCLRVLWTGEKHADQLILNKQSVADLVDYLVKIQNKK